MFSKVDSDVSIDLNRILYLILLLLLFIHTGCDTKQSGPHAVKAEKLLGNPNYQAISYGGYRSDSRAVQPSLEEFKEDLKILAALNIRLLRTYNVHLPHAENLLKAIKELKAEDPEFEMYVMLGAWINCLNAFSDTIPDHTKESPENRIEIQRSIELTNQYPDIVKVIAVGNEAMVKWATSYYVQPGVILKWVTYLQTLKLQGKLPSDLWITSSDNFASWGGGNEEYHVEDLELLLEAVDFVSMHTYPMHDTHYNPEFWEINDTSAIQNDSVEIVHAMSRAVDYAKKQYHSVKRYMDSLGIKKPIHIGETGWASFSDGFYGPNGSRACDEYKQYLYYQKVREWTNQDSITCFYFEAFDESWKDAANPNGSENHFGLFTIEGQAKLAIWDKVDKKQLNTLKRGNHKIIKTNSGSLDSIMKRSLPPPAAELNI